jgi:hypothetical protein
LVYLCLLNTIRYYTNIASSNLPADAVVLFAVVLFSYAVNISLVFAQIGPIMDKMQLAKYHLDQCVTSLQNNNITVALPHCQFADQQLAVLSGVITPANQTGNISAAKVANQTISMSR